MNYRRTFFHPEYHSLWILLLLACLAYCPVSQKSILVDLSEIIVPIGVSLGLAAYSIQLLREDSEGDRIERIALYGWFGAIIASVGSGWFVFQLQRELAVVGLLDEALTVLSAGSGIGIAVGTYVIQETSSPDRTDRDRVLTETVWTNKSESNPILTTVTTEIAELEGVGPLELDPLYEQINPDVFTDLRVREDSHWQLLFYLDEYEIRVSSQGTVTIYDTTDPNDEYSLAPSPVKQW